MSTISLKKSIAVVKLNGKKLDQFGTSKQATAFRRRYLDSKGINDSLTGINIVCDYAVTSLRRYELDYLLDVFPAFFYDREFHPVSKAFIVDNATYEMVKANTPQVTITWE